MLRGYSFRPRGWAIAATAAACVVFVLAGNWQARRAEQKRALGAELERSLKAPPIALAPQAGASRGPVRQNVDIDGFAAEAGLALIPVVLEQHNDGADGLAREWPRPDLGIEKHESYALQWYLFAALAIVLFAVLSFRRGAAR